MKKRLLRIKVSLLWIPYLLFLWYFEVTQMVVLVFMMLMIHELGHILMGYYLHISLTSMTIYPFGIFAQYDCLDHLPSKYEFLMAISGSLFQVFNFIILNILYQYQIVSLNQLDYYQMVNVQMLIFNLLPIFPLDGGRILRAVCMRIFPFVFALKVTYVISCVVFIILVWKLESLWMFCFVVLYVFYMYRESQLLIEKKLKFYYSRFCKRVNYKDRVHSYNDLFKDFHNIIVYGKKRMDEKEWISRYFVNKSKR